METDLLREDFENNTQKYRQKSTQISSGRRPLVCESSEIASSFRRWRDAVYHFLCDVFDIAFGIRDGNEAISHLMPSTRDFIKSFAPEEQNV